MSTKESIINKAIEVFNKNGLEYFGIRALAKELNIKAGNITYHFPTKNHLIAEIANRCTASSTGILNFQQGMNCYVFLQMVHQLFQSQYQFRNLLLSLPHIVREVEQVNLHYKEAQELRKNSLSKVLDILYKSGSVQLPSDSLNSHFVEVMLLIIRFWISDYSVNESIDPKGNHPFRHIHIISNFLSEISTEKGKEEIREFNNELQNHQSFEVI
jgi:AcrR family transcriptional regulator